MRSFTDSYLPATDHTVSVTVRKHHSD